MRRGRVRLVGAAFGLDDFSPLADFSALESRLDALPADESSGFRGAGMQQLAAQRRGL